MRVDSASGNVLTLYLLNGSAGPLGGDELRLTLDVADGAAELDLGPGPASGAGANSSGAASMAAVGELAGQVICSPP